MAIPALLTEANIGAARAVVGEIGFDLERVEPGRVLLRLVSTERGGSALAAFAALEAAGYDVSHVVTEL